MTIYHGKNLIGIKKKRKQNITSQADDLRTRVGARIRGSVLGGGTSVPKASISHHKARLRRINKSENKALKKRGFMGRTARQQKVERFFGKKGTKVKGLFGKA